ncbi:hypothetical protein CLF_110990, partial [Clonorchis sinensis]
ENRQDPTVEDLKNKVDQLAEQLAAVKTESGRHARTSRCYKCGRQPLLESFRLVTYRFATNNEIVNVGLELQMQMLIKLARTAPAPGEEPQGSEIQLFDRNEIYPEKLAILYELKAFYAYLEVTGLARHTDSCNDLKSLNPEPWSSGKLTDCRFVKQAGSIDVYSFQTDITLEMEGNTLLPAYVLWKVNRDVGGESGRCRTFVAGSIDVYSFQTDITLEMEGNTLLPAYVLWKVNRDVGGESGRCRTFVEDQETALVGSPPIDRRDKRGCMNVTRTRPHYGVVGNGEARTIKPR